MPYNTGTIYHTVLYTGPCSYQTDKKRREVQIRTQVSQKLEESGERDK